jgi:hypothetical protein
MKTFDIPGSNIIEIKAKVITQVLLIYNFRFLRPVNVCLAEHTFNQILSELRKANVGTCTRTQGDGEKIALLVIYSSL